MRFLLHTRPELNSTAQVVSIPNMTKSQVNFAKDNEYYTPKEVVRYFGEFDYDPATTKEKAKEFGIECYDTIETNGLTKDWTKYKRIWINPPFTDKHKFIKKAYDTYRENPYIYIYILFPIEFLTTSRFYQCSEGLGGKLYLPSGRIKFESGLGKHSSTPAFGSVVLKIQDKWELELFDIKDFEDKQLSIFDM